MEEKMNINLWKNAFDVSYWKNKDRIKDLLGIIESMEGIIKKYLEKTATDFPSLTDHSIVHSQMLWEYADIIIGKQNHYINPVEGFILNSVFLLHDAGMCYSILNNKADIEGDPIYQDYIIDNKSKLSKEELESEALFYTVRQRHGDYAIDIAVSLLNDEEFLIANIDYRQEFGEIIGKIAKSHSCNINYIEREFGKSYSSPKFPSAWSIDFQKLSFILRTADAAHIDNLRTPRTLKMIQEISGDSKLHWTFQKKIGFPSLESDGLMIYTTNTPFKQSEQKAWWYCYNALKILDDELRSANDYFVSKNLKGFKAKGIKYINDPLALGQNSIRTIGWESINTTIRVSNPVHIAAELGGKKLYRDASIAVRELIQNSIDSIHVHRIFTGQENTAVGRITVEIEKNVDTYSLTVTDNGIGMSQNLMTTELLDFGGSYWKSNKFYNDFKGLTSKGFEAIGKFGIGFFSVFMLGKEITVTSWKYGESIETMRTLHFYDGLFSNPILRHSTNAEKNRIIDRGTSIKIILDKNPYEKEGIIFQNGFKDCSIKSLVQYFIPSIDIEVTIKDDNGTISYLPPNNIEKLSFSEFFEYLNLKDSSSKSKIVDKSEKEESFKDLSISPIAILDGDRFLGKLAILPTGEDSFQEKSAAIILSKGIRIKELQKFVGYVNSSEVISIKRDEASATVPYNSMKEWAIKQLDQIEKLQLSEVYKKQKNNLIMTFNLFTDSFPLLRRKMEGKYDDVTISDFRNYLKENSVLQIFGETLIEANRSNNCDGFINTFHGVDMSDIILKEEQVEVIDSEKIIRKMLKEEWGNFEEEVEHNFQITKFYNEPYSPIWTF